MEIHEIRRYRLALRQFQRIARVQLNNFCGGVTLPQCLVLLEIDEHGHMTMGRLSSNLKLDLSTLSRTVENLVAKKLLARLKDDSDRRLVWIRLTEDGVSTCNEIHEVNDENCLNIFNNIPQSERDSMIRNFEALIQAYLDHESSTEGAREERTG